MKWYILFVKSGNELNSKKWLNKIVGDRLCCIVPQRRIVERKRGISKEVIKILFPGYVFMKLNMSYDKYYCIKKMPYLIKVLGSNLNYSEVSEEEMTPIINLTLENEIIGFSKAILKDSNVHVVSGPLKGNEELIQKVDKRKNRASLIFKIQGREKKIDLGIEFLYLDKEK